MRATRRRGWRDFDPRLENSGERRTHAREHDAPKDRDKKREPEALRIHQTMKQQDVHDDGGKYRERERHVTIDQEQDAANELNRENEQQIFRDEHRSEELPRHSARGRHRNEVKKSVEAEDQKDQTQ